MESNQDKSSESLAILRDNLFIAMMDQLKEDSSGATINGYSKMQERLCITTQVLLLRNYSKPQDEGLSRK